MSDTEVVLTADVPATPGDYTLVLLDAQGAEVGSAADVVAVVATPTSPVCFDVWPRHVPPYTATFYTVWGWLLQDVDCIGLDSPTAGSTNWSGFDFQNTGLTLPWANSLGPGVWNWSFKQGGSGGTVLCSRTAAVTVADVAVESVVPDTAPAATATTYTVTLNGGATFVGVVRLIDANGVAQPDIAMPDPDASSSTTEFSFTATLPLGVYDIQLWYWMLAEELMTISDAITVS